jgi:dimethylargininase
VAQLELSCLSPQSVIAAFVTWGFSVRQWVRLMTPTALTRQIPDRIAECELTHIERMPIDRDRAIEQHKAYEGILRSLGCTIEHLPPTPDLPDSVFVEDAAVVFNEVAVITRPGAESRRAETASVAGVLSRYRPLLFIEAPATVDGGDVLRVGRRVFVGLSGRTSREGAEQLRALLLPFDYSVETIETTGCLHLKSAATTVDDDWLLVNPLWVDPVPFGAFRLTHVDSREPFAANVLRVGQTVLCAAAFPHTRSRLDAHGLNTMAVDVSELAKAEAGVTCCSVIIE